MRRAADFTDTMRRGARARRGVVVLHHLTAAPSTAPGVEPSGPAGSPALVGLVVGRTVGNAVVRHRVSRRLRAQLAARLDRLPSGSRTVVRALPDAGTADSATLGRDLDAALRRLGAPVHA
jgi:ribonuclease P protein component